MILVDLITALKNDPEIAAIVEDRIVPFSVDLEEIVNHGTAIAYTFTPSFNDKVKRQDRLEIRIIAKTLLNAMELGELINSVLLTFADGNFNENIIRITQNGGGSSEDYSTQTIHYFLYYSVLSKA